jgi:septal ring factor EnvC (AmiA/AmiB activator)
MSRSHQIVGIAIVALCGIWGCSQAPSADSTSATAEKLKSVETKLARLEEDFRAAASARDQLSQKLHAAENARTALQADVAKLARDMKAKDELIQTRTAERDQALNQLKALKDGLKEILAKLEDGPKSDGAPTVPVIPASNFKPDVPPVPVLPSAPPPTR